MIKDCATIMTICSLYVQLISLGSIGNLWTELDNKIHTMHNFAIMGSEVVKGLDISNFDA